MANAAEKLHPGYVENLYRPIYELDAGHISLIAAGVMIAVGGMELSVSTGLAAGAGANAIRRYAQAMPMLRKQLRLFKNKMNLVSPVQLRKMNRAVATQNGKIEMGKGQIYLGEGFEWDTVCAQRAYQILDLSSDQQEIRLPWMLRPFQYYWRKEARKLGGRTWIQGMSEEKRIMANEDCWYGHTLITGNVGTGKTTLQKLLSLGAIHMGHIVIILDPKSDKSWRKSIKDEMAALGRENQFFEFDVSQPETSVYINPVENYQRITEVPDRIKNIFASTEYEDAFSNFGWQAVYQVCLALTYTNETLSLVKIYDGLTNGKFKLCERALERFFIEHIGPDWRVTRNGQLSKFKGNELERLMAYYESLVNAGEIERHETVTGIVQQVVHDQAHYSKMMAGLLPTFSNLCAEPLKTLLSSTDSDHKAQVNFGSLLESGGVLYVSSDAVSDMTTAGNISKLLLGSIVSEAARRYNYEQDDPRNVSLFIDEAHSSINDPLINLLATARGANFLLYIATQTVADLIAKSSPATAERILGLCNNFISMRVNDVTTKEAVSSNFGETNIKSTTISSQSQSSSATGLTEYSSGYGERVEKNREATFPQELLGDLPKLQFIARLSDGRKIKGRLGVITGEAA
ncbi:conjugative transfer system coupling protein TraD [Motilimonas cestriensis]|uniref:Conjugative transfer system coupling protein TraD n=1 Tax=Motilimonas cestriensis TaxID=2742685 RepID=A0ABS8WE27_9GAMM|nr:conjugative transfer system coupling protein TraD [Motilimonas cestriensis]MCE2597299.1 conjugative transfer system coupling protein TraD [Motilimonas cestriensis]